TGSAVLPIAVRREVAHAGDMNATHDNRTLRPPLTGALVYLLSNLPLGVFWFTLLLTLIITGASTAIIWVGIPISALAILLWRAGAQFERRRSRALLRTPVEEAYRPLPAQGHKQRWLTRLRDSTTWRDLSYLLLLLPVGLAEFTVVVTLGSLTLALLGLPIYYRFLPDGVQYFPSNDLQWMTVDSTLSALPWAVLGLLLLALTLVITRLLAAGHARLVRALLGPSTSHRDTTVRDTTVRDT